jgi:enoyl-CoA hydratase
MPDYARFKQVLARPDGRLLTVTLNRPEALNALSDAMQAELKELIEVIRTDDGVGAILLRGEGRAFCVGGDVKEMAESTSAPAARVEEIFNSKKLLYSLLEVEQPIVCAVHGFAMGLGATLALFSDIVIAADDAVFADNHVQVGLVAGDGGAALWPLLMPLGEAKYYLLTGDRLSGTEAARLGMVHRAVPADQVLDMATAIARRLADGATLALKWTKTAVNQVLRERLHLVLDIGLALEGATFLTEDHKEATTAFAEKRQPVFQGR